MWGFNHKPVAVALSKRLTLHLAKEYGLSDEAAVSLRMIEKRGRFAGRKVTFFRVFDPATLKAAGVNPLQFSDLPESAILHSGHIESDGHIACINGRN